MSATDHFARFDLPQDYRVDIGVLAERYRQLLAAVHPDRFAGGSAGEQHESMAQALAINEAYQTLKDPVRRAVYLLQLAGVDPLDPRDTDMPAEFLAEQIEWREQIEAAQGQGELLNRLHASCQERLEATRAAFAEAYGRDLEQARVLARQMRFLQKLIETIEAELDALAS